MSSTITNSKLLAQVSHDLRNYVSGIVGGLGIVSEDLRNYKARQSANKTKEFDAAAQTDLLDAIEMSQMLESNSMEMLNYLEDLLDESQVETGEFSLGKIEECNVEDIIKRMLVFNRGFIINQQVIVETDIEKNLPKLKCDVRRFKQILTNLLTNAAKYSQEQSKVKVSAKYLNQKIHIEVADSGIGMNETEIKMALNGDGEKIGKSGLNKDIDSHGIGLPIVKQLVELMGGELKIESKKGKGTIVGVALLVG